MTTGNTCCFAIPISVAIARLNFGSATFFTIARASRTPADSFIAFADSPPFHLLRLHFAHFSGANSDVANQTPPQSSYSQTHADTIRIPISPPSVQRTGTVYRFDWYNVPVSSLFTAPTHSRHIRTITKTLEDDDEAISFPGVFWVVEALSCLWCNEVGR